MKSIDVELSLRHLIAYLDFERPAILFSTTEYHLSIAVRRHRSDLTNQSWPRTQGRSIFRPEY